MMGGIKVICFLVLILCVSLAGRGETPRRVLVVHSYEDSYAGYPEFNRMISEAFVRKKMEVDLSFFYLDCESYREKAEVGRMYSCIDSMAVWKPEIILVNEDQAAYSLLKCAHPYLKTIPIIFAGVNYPNWELIRQYPNVTGFHDKIDYKKNFEMAQKLFGKGFQYFTVLDSTFLDRKIRSDLQIQLADENVFIQEKKGPWNDVKNKLKGKIWLRLISVRESKNGDLIWTLSKYHRNRCYLQFKRDFTTINVSNLNTWPSMTVINDGFGFNERLLGGYMTSLDTQVEEEVDAAVRLLNGEDISKIPIRESHKDYVLDWKMMEYFGIGLDRVPPHYKILNIPFSERYHALWLLSIILITILLAGIITSLLFLYLREQQRKRQAQADLLAKKETLELAIGGSNTFAWKLENDRFVFETAFWESLGVPERVFTIVDLIAVSHPDDRVQIQYDWTHRYAARKKISQQRCDFNGKGYQWWEFRYTSSPLSGDSFKTAGLLLNVQSIKDKEYELEEARRLAEKAELKESFLTNMSHEIRTPLNAIVGFSNVLTMEAGLSDEEKQEYINIINLNTELLLKLINDILEISRLDSGQMSFDYETCKVSDLMNDIYQTHSVLVPSRLQFLKEEPQGDSPEIYVDKGRVMQVLTNFLNNACKFTVQGYIRLGYLYRQEEGEVHIYVEDTGKGIPAEEQKIIFNRFYKKDEFAQGTGLGLSICKGIIEKLGGRIELQSEVGKGSRFTIVIPCVC